MKHFIFFFRTYRKYLSKSIWVLLLLTITVAFADGLGISMLLPLLQSLDIGNTPPRDNIIFQVTNKLGITGSLIQILFFMFAIFLLKALLKFGTGYFQALLFRKLYQKLKVNFFDAVMKTDYLYFSTKNAGYYIAIMIGHTEKLVKSFNTFVILVTSVVMTLTYLLMASIISWQVSVMAVALGFTILMLLNFVNRLVQRLSKHISKEQTRINQVAIQALHSFKYIISTATSYPIQKQYEKSVKRLSHFRFKSQLASAFTASLQEFLSVTLLIGMIIIEVIVLGYPIGSVIVVLLLFYRGVNQMMSIQVNWQNLLSSQGFLESVDDEMERLKQQQVNDSPKESIVALNSSTLTFNNLCFSYSNDKSLTINNLSFKIKPNSMIALVGPSGSGKTTIVDLLTGILQPDSGSIIYNDRPLNHYSLQSWRSRIGYVSQDLTIFDDTVYNNICLFDTHADQFSIENAARMALAHEFIEKLPFGYHTPIGDRGVRLSGGQKQRLFIARELYKKPDLLILDEATSALDSQSEKFIQASINKLKGLVTVIIIAHRLSTIRNVDEIYVIEQGRVVESGSYESLTFTTSSRFSKMVKLQEF